MNSLSALRDLPWRLRQLPPRLRLLARWCLTLILSGAGVVFLDQVCFPRTAELTWVSRLLEGAGWSLFAAALFGSYGVWRAHRQRHLKSEEVSRIYDARWTAFYPGQLFQALFTAGLTSALSSTGLFGAPSWGLAHETFLSLSVFYAGGNLLMEGVRLLKIVLRDLPPPRARTVKRALRFSLGLLGGRLSPG